MAINIGLFFLHRSYQLHWLSHSSERLNSIEKTIARTYKRIKCFFPEKLEHFHAGCSLYGSDVPEPDIVIESSRESLAPKQEIFQSLSYLFTEQTLLFSTSSSLLPHTIHSRCLGAHFFYPVELTNIVELISSTHISETVYHRSSQFLRENSLDVIEQDVHSAFLLNRLLLPLQAVCFKALQNGFAPADVEAASRSELISFGQLSLMDSIGLDIVKAAAVNYRHFIATIPDQDFNNMLLSLDQLLQMGKVGAKNNNGLLVGTPLPWPQKKKDKKKLHSLRNRFKQLLEDGCREAVQQKKTSKEHLRMSLDRVFHAATLADDFF